MARAASPRWTPRGDVPQSPAWVPDRDRDQERMSAYSKELQMWVDVHVNKNLKLAMRDVDAEIASVRQESRSALDLARREEERAARFECLLRSAEQAVQQQNEGIGALRLQTELDIEGLLQVVTELKQKVSHQENDKIHDEHKKLHKEYQVACDEIRHLQKSQEKELKALMEGQRDLQEMASGRGIRAWADSQEGKLLCCRNDMNELAQFVKLQFADLHQEFRGLIEGHLAAFSAAQQDSRGLTEGRLTDLSKALSHAAKQTDIEHIKRGYEEARRQLEEARRLHLHWQECDERLGKRIDSLQNSMDASLNQKYLSGLRSETAAMVKNEFAAVRALDEQLWMCDQRLGQRIDSLQQSMDEITRSCDQVMRESQESMSAVKLLVQTNAWQTCSRSPEHSQGISTETEGRRALDPDTCDWRTELKVTSTDALRYFMKSPKSECNQPPDSSRKRVEMDVGARSRQDTLKSSLASPRPAQTLIEEIESERHRGVGSRGVGRSLRRSD